MNILITGGTSGLGKFLAERLECAGHTIAILGRCANEKEPLEFRCDITNYSELEASLTSFVDQSGSIDVMINNAAMNMDSRDFTSANPERMRRLIETNVTGLLYAFRAVTPIMQKQKQGLIININSFNSIVPRTYSIPYSVSEVARKSATELFHDYLSKYGIRVTGIYLGALEYGMKGENGEKVSRDNNSLSYEEVFDAINFILNLPNNVSIPSIQCQHALYGL